MTHAPTPPESRGSNHTEQALEGLRVLELGRLIAELGAEVIKIETPGKGDPLRSWHSVDRRTGMWLWWPLQSRDKKLITLNGKHAEGKITWYGGTPSTHNEHIYCRLPGHSSQALERLVRQGVI